MISTLALSDCTSHRGSNAEIVAEGLAALDDRKFKTYQGVLDEHKSLIPLNDLALCYTLPYVRKLELLECLCVTRPGRMESSICIVSISTAGPAYEVTSGIYHGEKERRKVRVYFD